MVFVAALFFPISSLAAHDNSLYRSDTTVDVDYTVEDGEGFDHINVWNQEILYQSQLELEFSNERNSNLNRANNRDDIGLLTEYSLVGIYRQSERFQLFGRVKLSSEIERRKPGASETETELSLKGLYGRWRLADREVFLTVGRQEVVDDRKWVFDEDIDAISYLKMAQDHAWQAFIGRESLWRDGFTGEHNKEKPNVYFLQYYQAFNERKQGSAYVLHVDGRGFGDDERSSYVGGQIKGRLPQDLNYWAQGALMFGRTGSDKVSGLGFDVGITKKLHKLKSRPYFTLALAYGGGNGSDDQAGGTFRQSGLHSNKGRFGGVASFRYYGHVFDPELSNIVILTAGVGIRPNRNWSVDLIYHRYNQISAASALRDDGIRVDPNGMNRRLGSEIDLVFGLRNWREQKITLEAVMGFFYPGEAYGASRSSSNHFELLLKWKF
ncbi:MAG: alginate export family protein [Burkholderiaceae bacterium]